jgi:hypothetical protein
VLEQEDWDVLCLPAIAEADECHLIDGPLGRRFFGRQVGDILHPARESATSLANKVLLPKDAAWLHDFIAEVTGFPGSRYADQVDWTTQALGYLRNNDDVSIWARLAPKTRQERLGS